MEGISTVTVLVAPQPTSAFEAYVIQELKKVGSNVESIDERLGSMDKRIGSLEHSQDDLIESVRFITDVMATKEDVESLRISTKEDLAASEYRIKMYVDKVVTGQKESIVPLLREEDEKVDVVITELEEEGVFDEQQSRELRVRGPFPKLA